MAMGRLVSTRRTDSKLSALAGLPLFQACSERQTINTSLSTAITALTSLIPAARSGLMILAALRLALGSNSVVRHYLE